METLDHLWTCPATARHPSGRSLGYIMHKVKKSITKHISDLGARDSILRHPVWSTTSLPNSITLGWFIRGVVPSSFVSLLADALKTSNPMSRSSFFTQAHAITVQALDLLQDLLYQHKWHPRCELFAQASLAQGITHQDKRTYKSGNVTLHKQQQSTPPTKFPFHHKWIEEGITKGFSWKDFPSDVNSADPMASTYAQAA